MSDILQRIERGERSSISPNELVSWLKRVDNQIGLMGFESDMDFVGCSAPYVREKIMILENSLKWVKRRIKIVDDMQRQERSRRLRTEPPEREG